MKIDAVITKLKPFLVALVCVIVALGTFIYAKSRASEVAELEQRQEDLQRQIGLIDANTRSSTGLAEQVEALERGLEAVSAKLFEPDARAINTNFFYQLEREANVRIVQARQAGVRAGGANATFSMIDFALVVEGTFEELVEFVYRLQTLDAFIRPVNLTLQTGGTAGRTATAGRQMSMSINLSVLARKTS